MIKYFLFLSMLYFIQPSFSQDPTFVKKFRKVSIEELKMDSCEFYSNADAMVLFNYGDLYLNVESSRGLVYVLEVHKRIKIFTKKGKNYASDKIRYTTGKIKMRHDDIRGFKAYTYNLKDGGIVETKLEKSDMFINKVSNYSEELSFTMPKVQIGSILDIKYKIVSNNLSSLKTWYFQDLIPVKYSEFNYIVPDFLRYRSNTLGNISGLKTEKIYKSINILGTFFQGEGKILVQNNILPLEIEPYMGGIFGLLSRIELNLIYIDSNYGFDVDLGSSYEKLNEDLMEDIYFGKRLSKGRFSKNWKSEMKDKSQLEKAKFILNKIQKNIAWNKRYGFNSKNSGRGAYKKQLGSIGDINLSLIAAFRYYNIAAFPVILKTRKYGLPHPVYPKKWGFNYLIALVKIDGKEYLCDASLDTPFGLIRKESINDKGWLVDESGNWVDLTKDAYYSESAMYDLEIKDNVIYNNISIQLKDYAAYEAYQKSEGDIFEKELKKVFSNWEIKKITYDKSNNGLVFKFKVKLERSIIDNNFIIIEPFIFDTMKKNPFTREERYSNIDFIYKEIKNYFFNLKIPANYSVELPVNNKLMTENRKLGYYYLASRDDSRVKIVYRSNSNSTVFAANEYNVLKEFYEKVSISNKQVVVLKANSEKLKRNK